MCAPACSRAKDSLRVKQIVDILTRFSLFQIYDQDALSVHRLVQEVIRNDIDDPIQLKRVLGYATRMVNKALQSNSHEIVAIQF
jgi:hypothetical protein